MSLVIRNFAFMVFIITLGIVKEIPAMQKTSGECGGVFGVDKAVRFESDDFDVVEFDIGIHERIRIRSMYYETGFSDRPTILGRKIVLKKLLEALSRLPEKYGFLIWDVYRPRDVQAKLFGWMRQQVRGQYPQLSDPENYEMARKYMSAPSKVGDSYTPPHLSGGAIDLTLMDTTTFVALEMGTPFDDCTEKAHSKYYEERESRLSHDEREILERRRILTSVMTGIGFTPYQYEWWHFDIGNIFWSKNTGNDPVFGPLLGDLEWPID